PANFYNGTSVNDFAANKARTPFTQSYSPANLNNGAIGAGVPPVNDEGRERAPHRGPAARFPIWPPSARRRRQRRRWSFTETTANREVESCPHLRAARCLCADFVRR
ncbi:MAG: hypothetical protein WBE59_03465, partial [Candidatus Cybelea sp.]